MLSETLLTQTTVFSQCDFQSKLNRCNSMRPVQYLCQYVLVVAALFALLGSGLSAQAPPEPGEGYEGTPIIPGQRWGVHDKHRPRPAIVTPGSVYGEPPSDAVVLFDGSDLEQWQKAGSNDAAGWKVEDGYMEVVGGTGTIRTKESFGDVQLHLEFATPADVQKSGQGRGNSGIIFMGRYEVQILDSYENNTYADGQLGAIYGQFPPQVNPARSPGEWQAYDIIFEAPRFEADALVSPPKVTVFLNGVLLHHAREMIGPMAHKEVHPFRPHPEMEPLHLQDHGNPTRFRNIWVRSLRTEVEPWLEFEGQEGLPGSGKTVVLVSGDEEYRSEEALPMLAQILSQRHGFDCKVLFAINPETGTVDPNYTSNIPGLHFLDQADLMFLFTRFRSLPDWQMAFFEKYLEAGKPMIAMRTATHAFNFPKDSDSQFKHWGWNSKEWEGGFGQQVLGDTWVSHHGHHKYEATRGIVPEEAASNPIVQGVSDVFGPTDVYGLAHLPEDADVLLLGQVLDGMEPDSKPVDGVKNDPMVPVAWTRIYENQSGAKNRVFTTTMGASIDLVNEDLRRLLVNASYWCIGLEDQIPEKSDVTIDGEYSPTFYGFHTDPIDYFSSQRLKPSDYLVK